MILMTYFAVSYEYNPNNPQIAKTRPAHREFIASLHAEGKILGSGPHPDSLGGALIILQLADATSTKDVIALMDQDPYYIAGTITKRSFREWNPVINSFES